MTSAQAISPTPRKDHPWSIFLVFLRLGLTSFGGPIAHLGYFRDEFVSRRSWLSERSYADLVALCQFLPGPASSQVGMALGLSRGGYSGAFAAWAGFTLPSAVALMLFAVGIASYAAIPSGVLHGLNVVAVAVVTQAVWGMARKLCTDAPRITIMALAACIALVVPDALGQVLIIVMAGLSGLVIFKLEPSPDQDALPISISRRAGLFWLTLFFSLLIALPILTALLPHQGFAYMNAFFQSGALVFGGGHVVLPLLHAATVAPGWVSDDTFLAGYGAAQAVPGPLFTFAAFLGASMNAMPSKWIGGLLCLAAIFAPSFLLVFGALPFWEQLRRNVRAQAALLGVNAAVVGLLLAAFFQPVWTSAIHRPRDIGMAIVAFVSLVIWRLAPWLVVLGSALVGWLLKDAVFIF